MPAMIRAPCPGLPRATGCFIAAGQAHVHGRCTKPAPSFTASARRFPRLHELGHFDATMLDADERERFPGFLHLRDLLWTWSNEDALGRVIHDPRTLAEPRRRLRQLPSGTSPTPTPTAVRHRNVGPGELWEVGYDCYPTRRCTRTYAG
jgi:hypothetical protein